jgi:uncharacterized protein YbcI
MPGFEFRHRLGGGQSTIDTFALKSASPVGAGDMLKLVDGQATVAAAGDAFLLGAAVEVSLDARPRPSVRAITDADAVYAVQDGDARRQGDTLGLAGATGAHGLTTRGAGAFTVIRDSPADEETLVRISAGFHQTEAPQGHAGPSGGELNAAVARLVVRYFREQMGRGPTKARAFYRDDVIVVVLEDLMTKAERRLVEGGHDAAVVQMRQAFQETMRDDLVATVEALTGTKVRAFLSGNNLDPDIAVEVFVLAQPVSGDIPPPRRPRSDLL